MSHDGASTSKSTDISSSSTFATNEITSLGTKRDASWPAVLFYIHLNILGLYGIMVLFSNTSLITVIFSELFYVLTFLNSIAFSFVYEYILLFSCTLDCPWNTWHDLWGT